VQEKTKPSTARLAAIIEAWHPDPGLLLHRTDTTPRRYFFGAKNFWQVFLKPREGKTVTICSRSGRIFLLERTGTSVENVPANLHSLR
jgi:hypothetical protein